MEAASPNLAGFADAQSRLRERFGETILFHLQEETEYPAGTATDPETGEAYDPTVTGSATSASAAVTGTVAYRPRVEGDQRPSPLGWMESAHVMLDVDISHRSAIEGAKAFTVRGERYLVVGGRPDGVAGVQRYLVFGRFERRE